MQKHITLEYKLVGLNKTLPTINDRINYKKLKYTIRDSEKERNYVKDVHCLIS